ncbi:MAG: glycosyltransferase family 4 protein [Verrucomicrobiota bacterium]|nr:glycosyltransferase family 4 protein [Verrucomicrobiota bacterium]
MKKFLIITQVFRPDPAAVGQYFDEAAQAIAGTGAQVTMLTANRGYDNPKEKFLAGEARDGIQIQRLPLSSFGKASITIRIFAQLSFLVQCVLRGLFARKLTDLLVSTSPPMAAITAVIIGFFRPKLKVHYWVMDINPDQAIVLGTFSHKHPLVKALDWLNRRILKRADSIIVLDRFMQARLESKLKRPAEDLRSPIQVIPLWPMDDYLETVAHSENSFRKKHGWEDKFVVMHSGNHSLVHPLDTILDAADALKGDPRFVFVFIGGGRGKEIVDARLREQSSAASNIISLPYQPLDQIRFSLSAADLHIVSLGNEMSGIVHPCKIYGILSIGRPVLSLGPKESYLNNIIEKKGIGLKTEPTGAEITRIGWSVMHGNIKDATAALKAAISQTHKEREAICLRAQEKALDEFGRNNLILKFLDTIVR